MKKLFNSLFLLTALTLTTAVFTGCKDEPDKYEVSDGNPTISYIRPLGAESADSLLTDLKAHPKRYVHFSIFGKKDK